MAAELAEDDPVEEEARLARERGHAEGKGERGGEKRAHRKETETEGRREAAPARDELGGGIAERGERPGGETPEEQRG